MSEPEHSPHEQPLARGVLVVAAVPAVLVGGQLDAVWSSFERCVVVDELDNGVGVDNEEQGQPVALCSSPRVSWDALWAQLRHLD